MVVSRGYGIPKGCRGEIEIPPHPFGHSAARICAAGSPFIQKSCFPYEKQLLSYQLVIAIVVDQAAIGDDLTLVVGQITGRDRHLHNFATTNYLVKAAFQRGSGFLYGGARCAERTFCYRKLIILVKAAFWMGSGFFV